MVYFVVVINLIIGLPLTTLAKEMKKAHRRKYKENTDDELERVRKKNLIYDF